MLLLALKLQLAALVTVAGVDTEKDITSPDVRTALVALDKARAEATDGKADINKASADAVKAIGDLAQKDGASGADASYVLALWARLGVLGQQFTVQQLVNTYQKAVDGGNKPAKAELGAILIQNFPQDVPKVEQGVKLIKESEADGNASARRALAQILISGLPTAKVDRDVKAGIAMLEKGSAAKDGQATFSLAQIHAAGIKEQQQDGSIKEVIPASESKALDYLKTAAGQEFPPAMNEYAARMFRGDKDGKGADPKAAVEMFDKAAKNGSAAAHRLLGEIYLNGLGNESKNFDKALEHYVAAARGNDGQAQLFLGNASQNGFVKDSAKDKKVADLKPEDVAIAPNPSQALTFYRLAAQNNIAQAAYMVGLFYETGTVVDKDPAKAFALIQRAAVSGVPAAAHRLGGYYQQGVGTPQDPVAAAAWVKRAADAGIPQAQLDYGAILENGTAGERTLLGAAAQYQKAADAGLLQAMINLAQVYERGGEGFPKDMVKAWVNASLAAEYSKSEQAKTYADGLKKAMSSDEQAKAQKEFDGKKAEIDAKIKGDTSATGAATTPASTPATTPSSSGSKSGTKAKGGTR